MPLTSSASNASSESLPYLCFNLRASVYMAASFTATKSLLLLPLCVLVLVLRLGRRRGPVSSSHSDVFSFHMMLVELLSVSGWSLFCCGAYVDLPLVVFLGYYTMLASFPGQMLFHCLTCVERYLAVVHPIAYLALRSGRRLRNLSIGCVWAACAAWTGALSLYCPVLPSTPLFCLLGLSVLVVSFCSVSVFCVLTRPGPGDGARARVDPSKRRAVVTIVAVMAVLLLHFVGFVLSIALRVSRLLSFSDGCAATVSAMWFSLPSSLLLPLLALLRARAAWTHDVTATQRVPRRLDAGDVMQRVPRPLDGGDVTLMRCSLPGLR